MWLVVLPVLTAPCCGLVGIRLVLRLGMRELIHRIGALPVLALMVLVFSLVVIGVREGRRAARWSLTRWGARTGWSPVVGRSEWPWTPQQPTADTVTVELAVGNTVDGFAVTVGELSWDRAGLGGSVEQSQGHGVFAVVRLPRSYPYTSVQRRRNVARRRAGENEFIRRFRIIVDEPYFADQLADPALRDAHLAGRVPPWTIVGDELYAVVASRLPLRPARVVAAAEQALYLVRLLGIRPLPAVSA